MSSPWDQRYLGEEYVFGTEPNEFIRRIRPYLPSSGKALDLATGEGRNAVFLAECGLDTEGVDLSAVGLEKPPSSLPNAVSTSVYAKPICWTWIWRRKAMM